MSVVVPWGQRTVRSAVEMAAIATRAREATVALATRCIDEEPVAAKHSTLPPLPESGKARRYAVRRTAVSCQGRADVHVARKPLGLRLLPFTWENRTVPNRPNIVLIFSDQHRGDALGCVGNPVVRTPNLDGLAAEGVIFRNCNTNSPLCMPARASLITGMYVNEHGAWGNRTEADRHGPSHVRNIRDAGYCTAVIGKTHFRLYQADDGHTRDHASGLRDWGYEFAHETKDTIPSATHRCYYTDFLAERGKLQVYEDCARNFRLGQSTGFLRPWEHLPNLLEEDEHIDIYIANTASEWIRSYADDRPFYLQVCLMGPHPPFDAPAKYRDMFDPEEMPQAIMEPPVEPVSPQIRTMFSRRGLKDMTESQSRTFTSHYYAKVAFDDHAIGVVLVSSHASNVG